MNNHNIHKAPESNIHNTHNYADLYATLQLNKRKAEAESHLQHKSVNNTQYSHLFSLSSLAPKL